MSGESSSFLDRVQGKLNPVTVRYYYGPRLEKSRPHWPYLVRVMTAHVAMMGARGVIPGSVAALLLECLDELAAVDPKDLKLDPSYEDMYVNLEKLVGTRLPPEVAGYLSLARSRNDVESTILRMGLRDAIIGLSRSLLNLVEAMLERAQETADFVMPGYTYGQQAQPITMGHYLTAITTALLRDAERFSGAYERVNQCPLGSAALAGTGFPIDRALVAELLGFAQVAENTLDATTAADLALEVSSVAAICAHTLARLAEDVEKWCSNEFGFASLPDDLIDSSTIMPQKRNPVIVATVRAQARLLAGRLSGLLAACSVRFEPTRDVTVAEGEVWDCLHLVGGLLEITLAIVQGLCFHPEAMVRALELGFSTATDLADSLVREGGMSFRLAHKVVGAAIAGLYDRGLGPSHLTYEVVDASARQVAGMPLPLDREDVRRALDYREGVKRRAAVGGPAPAEVRRMVGDQRALVSQLRSELAAREESLRGAGAGLKELVARLRGSGIVVF